MLVKCEKCGYENFPQHRYCGMCAAALPFPIPPSPRANPEPPPLTKPASRSSPAALDREPVNAKGVGYLVPDPPRTATRPVSRSSAAPLEHQEVDARSVSYLLEDEPAPSHGGRNFLLLVLLVAVLAGAWYWREELISLTSRFSSGSTQPNSSAPAGSDQASAAAQPSSANAGTPIEKPSGTAGDQTAALQSQTPLSPPPTAGAGSGSADTTQSPQGDQSQPGQASLSGSPSDEGAVKPDESAEITKPAPIAKPSQLRTRPAPASGVDDLEIQGERYLYGNGVPENCALARKSLLAAAQRSSAKAQNVLGTMYATGHCATRDLPTAYRWFGRSLRQDPGNTRIEQDLKVLWNQMTPEEQRLALRTEH